MRNRHALEWLEAFFDFDAKGGYLEIWEGLENELHKDLAQDTFMHFFNYIRLYVLAPEGITPNNSWSPPAPPGLRDTVLDYIRQL